MNAIKQIGTYTIGVAIIYFIIGLIMLINPKFISDALSYILGSLIIIYGLIYLINLYKKRENEIYNKFNYLAGILSVSFGLFLIINSKNLLSIIPFSGGIIILLDSIFSLRNSLKIKKTDNYWYIYLIINIIFILFSIYLMINSNNVTYILIRIMGLVIIIDGIMDLILNKKNNNINKKNNEIITIE